MSLPRPVSQYMCFSMTIKQVSWINKPLTSLSLIRLFSVPELVGVDAHKVHQLPITARVHDDPAILLERNLHRPLLPAVTIGRTELCCFRVGPELRGWDHEAEGGEAGWHCGGGVGED
jgi:hypothetical protein